MYWRGSKHYFHPEICIWCPLRMSPHKYILSTVPPKHIPSQTSKEISLSLSFASLCTALFYPDIMIIICYPTSRPVQNVKQAHHAAGCLLFTGPAPSSTKVDLQPCCGHQRKLQVSFALTVSTGLRVCPILPASMTRKTKESGRSHSSALFMRLANSVERANLRPKVQL